MKLTVLSVVVGLLIANPAFSQVTDVDNVPEAGITAEVPEGTSAQDRADDTIRRQVAKVLSSKRNISLTTPWKRGEISKVSGSGVWLGNGRILTNAHVVMYSSQLDVQPYDSSERITAEIESISPEMDLAVLKLEDSSLFDDLEPLPFSVGLPRLRSSVQAYGYPTGGSAISVTEGVISRIEYTAYAFETYGLRIQVDAGINPGNSGGPAISDGKIVGIISSRLRTGDNIGYLIPSEEVELFLDDVQDGKYDGKPFFRESMQNLRNKAFRSYLNVGDDETGVVVVDTIDDGSDYPISPGDVLTHVGPHDIDNDGMVRLEGGIRLMFQYFVPKLAKDGLLPVSILRDGKKIDLQVPVGNRSVKLVEPLKGDYPKYFVYGPAVFVEATTDFLDSYLQAMMAAEPSVRLRVGSYLRIMINTGSPLVKRASEDSAGQRLVLLASPLLPHRISKGYAEFNGLVLKSINDVPITGMEQMTELLRDLDTEFVKFEFETKDSRRQIVFRRADAESATEAVLDEYSIPRQGSRSLLKLWNQAEPDTGADQ